MCVLVVVVFFFIVFQHTIYISLTIFRVFEWIECGVVTLTTKPFALCAWLFFPVSSLFFVIIINNFFITDKMLKDQNSMHILKPFDKQNIICKRLGKVSYFDRQLVNTTIRFMNFYVSVVSTYFYLYACVCLMQCDCNRIYKTITVAFTVSPNGKCTFFIGLPHSDFMKLTTLQTHKYHSICFATKL